MTLNHQRSLSSSPSGISLHVDMCMGQLKSFRDNLTLRVKALARQKKKEKEAALAAAGAARPSPAARRRPLSGGKSVQSPTRASPSHARVLNGAEHPLAPPSPLVSAALFHFAQRTTIQRTYPFKITLQKSHQQAVFAVFISSRVIVH